MPAAVMIDCVSKRPLRYGELRGKGVHGAFLEAVRRFNPELSKQIHDPNRSKKPFTLGVPGPWFGKQHEYRFRFRLTILDDSLFPILAELQDATKEKPLRIGSNVFSIESVSSGVHSPETWVERMPWQELYDRAGTSAFIRLQFQTAITFRKSNRERKTRMHQPFPLPHLVLGSAMMQWKQWSKVSFDPQLLDIVEETIEVINLNLSSHKVPIHYQNNGEMNHPTSIEGTIGTLTYRLIDKSISREQKQQINALADSLFYTGAGYKTTMGMGMIRRIS